MRLTAGYWGFRDYTPSNYFHTAAQLGFRRVEIPMYEEIKTASHLADHEVWDYRTGASRQELVELAESAGVEMVASVANIPMGPEIHHWQNDAGIEFGMAVARRAIDISADLGVGMLRVVEPVADPTTPGNSRTALREVGKCLDDLGDYASNREVTILVENHALTSDEVNAILDAADHPVVGTNYDAHNYYRTGEDPLAALSNLRRDKIYYCHLKDASDRDAGNPEEVVEDYQYPPPVPLGDGVLDWPAILTELAEFYDGYVGIEHDLTGNVVSGLRRSKQYLARLADDHAIEFD